MTPRRHKLTSDGAIVIEKNGDLIVRDGDAVLSWANKLGAAYGIAAEKRACLFVGAAEHFGRISPEQAVSLCEQLGGFRWCKRLTGHRPAEAAAG